MTPNAIIASLMSGDSGLMFARAREHWGAAQRRAGRTEADAQLAARRSGFALGRAASADRAVRRGLTTGRPVLQVAKVAVSRNLLTDRAVADRVEAEKSARSAGLRAQAAGSRRRHLRSLLDMEALRRAEGNRRAGEGEAGRRLRALAVRASQEGDRAALADMAADRIEAIEIGRPSEVEDLLAQAQQIARAAGLDVDAPGIRLFPRLYVQTPPSPMSALTGMLAHDLAEPCGWLCKVRRAFEAVGPSVGTAAEAAGGSVARQDSRAGGVISASGGFVRSIASAMRGEFTDGYREGLRTPVEGEPSGVPWGWVLAGLGVVGLGGYALVRRRRAR